MGRRSRCIVLKSVRKFNFEAGMTESDIEVDIGRLKTIAASLLTGLGLNNNPQVAYHSLNENLRGNVAFYEVLC